ncbi:helix-turn-helix domain-containing protein [Oceanobacillus alkalisoli]|uniref:helix-turn-helix domain-containing protein n=1 Tax=Oceanobacillus alkalisoli TaxID=2925113 RepID=UPI001EE406C5|nr:helix-turn-helix domain-containing protein [Oceanobacillus alkalisoli]MCG5104528.1 helix-turn-helix domain-containing protein [Oceanobacillus alkalisoli]
MINKVKRSVLYNIEPVGIGTKNVESLTSYLMRVSYEHNLNVGDLISKLVVPSIGIKYLIRSSKFGGNRFYEGAKTINGYMDNSINLVNVMEELTTRNDLSSITLLKWKDYIPLRKLFKESLSWCPECLRYMNNNEQRVYFPLLWYLKVVTVCIEHKYFLTDKCHTCGSKIDILRRKMIVGYCPYCLNSLEVDFNRKTPNAQELKWQTYVTKNLEDLLINKLPIDFRKRIRGQLNLSKEELFEGSISKFSNYLGFSKSTVHSWINGDNFPSLVNLLIICFKLNKNISDLQLSCFSTDTNIFKVDHHIERSYKKTIRNPLNNEVIVGKLEELLNRQPPTSMYQVAREIGHDRRVLYKKYPQQCKNISRNYSDYLKTKSQQRIKSLKVEIDYAFNSLKKENIYPSRRKIETFVNKNGLLRERALQDYWKMLLIKNGFGDNSVRGSLFHDE